MAAVETWTRRWRALPDEYKHAFQKHGITDEPVDGRIYARLWKRQEQGYPTPIRLMADDIHKNNTQQNTDGPNQGPTPDQAKRIWKTLADMHEAMTQSTVYGDSFYHMQQWLWNPPPNQPTIEPTAAATAYKKYKTWKPRDTKQYDYTTQQAIDKNLLEQWTERLLRCIRPYNLPYMQDNPEPHQQKRLLGKTKWTTIRGHTQTLEKTTKQHPDLLRWNTPGYGNRVIHDLLDTCNTNKFTKSKLTRTWDATNWICRRMGYSAPGEEDDLQAAFQHTTTELGTPLYKEPQRAHMPPNEVVRALEKASTDKTRTTVYRYYASALRTELAVSARYIDMQHTAPHSVRAEGKTIHLAPWQTKTTYRGDNIKTKYVATQHSMTDTEWWQPLVEQSAKFHDAFPQMDYMYPKTNSTKTRFILQPASHNTVQTMLRHILETQGVDPHIVKKRK